MAAMAVAVAASAAAADVTEMVADAALNVANAPSVRHAIRQHARIVLRATNLVKAQRCPWPKARHQRLPKPAPRPAAAAMASVANVASAVDAAIADRAQMVQPVAFKPSLMAPKLWRQPAPLRTRKPTPARIMSALMATARTTPNGQMANGVAAAVAAGAAVVVVIARHPPQVPMRSRRSVKRLPRRHIRRSVNCPTQRLPWLPWRLHRLQR